MWVKLLLIRRVTDGWKCLGMDGLGWIEGRMLDGSLICLCDKKEVIKANLHHI